jgi:hypothetical protein
MTFFLVVGAIGTFQAIEAIKILTEIGGKLKLIKSFDLLTVFFYCFRLLKWTATYF